MFNIRKFFTLTTSSGAGEASAHRRRDFFPLLHTFRYLFLFLFLLWLFSQSSRPHFQSIHFFDCSLTSDRGQRSWPATLPSPQPLSASTFLKCSPTEKPHLFRSKSDPISSITTLTSDLFYVGTSSLMISVPTTSLSFHRRSYLSPQIRRTITVLCSTEALLRFLLMGHSCLSPLTNSRPIPKSNDPSPLMTWPGPSKAFPQNHRCLIHVAKCLKMIDIMIPSLRSDDYRSFFKCSSPIHLLIDFILEIISYTLGTTLESKSLMKNGIMIPSPRNGGYQIFSNHFYPLILNLVPQTKPEKTFTSHESPPLVLTSLLRFVPASHVAKDTFSKSKDQVFLIVTTPKLHDLVAKVSMIHHEVACGLLFDCFCLCSSMDYKSYRPFLVVNSSSLKLL
ncbi:hypothetical protein AtEden1_Chr5g0108321 [Arabidopsis thaliana]